MNKIEQGISEILDSCGYDDQWDEVQKIAKHIEAFMDWCFHNDKVRLWVNDQGFDPGTIREWWIHLPDLNWKRISFEDLYQYWIDTTKKPTHENH